MSKTSKICFLILKIKTIQQVVHYGINMLSMWTHKLDMTNDMLIPTLTKHEPRAITLIGAKTSVANAWSWFCVLLHIKIMLGVFSGFTW